AVEVGLAREGERRGLEPRGAVLGGRTARLAEGRTRGRRHVGFEEEKGHEGEAHTPTFLFLQDIGIIASCMMVTIAVTIRDVNTVENGNIVGMASSRSIPHLTRLSRRVNASATEAALGMNLKQTYMLAALRDQGELPQQELCDLMHLTQNTVVTWLNELED